MEKRRAEILERAKACDTGYDGVIVLTDMFGGTPSNLAISIMEQSRIEVLAGLNLPILVKLASVRGRPQVHHRCFAAARPTSLTVVPTTRLASGRTSVISKF